MVGCTAVDRESRLTRRNGQKPKKGVGFFVSIASFGQKTDLGVKIPDKSRLVSLTTAFFGHQRSLTKSIDKNIAKSIAESIAKFRTSCGV